MMPLDEMRKRDAQFDQMVSLATVHPQAADMFYKTLVQIKGTDGRPENYIRVSTTYSCSVCKTKFERALAKAPSWAIVEINQGPGQDKIIST